MFDLSQARTGYAKNQEELYKMPFFEKSNFGQFQYMIKNLTMSNSHVVNFYGQNGVMNKKLVNEVSNYLRMRYYFPKGIFWLHVNSQSFRADFDTMCESLKQNLSSDI